MHAMHALHTTRPLLVLLALVLCMSACYEESARLPTTPAGSASGSNPAATAGPGAQATTASNGGSQVVAHAPWEKTIATITHRLGKPGVELPVGERPGAGSWRSVELEKLKELITVCCNASAENCRRCIEPIARLELPADEMWPLLGQFLGPLRARAEIGLTTLGTRLLTHSDGEVRDRIYRMAVAGGVSRRGQPDAEHRRASTVPLLPQVGEPIWVIVEELSPCPNVRGEMKGPDRSGRLDLVLTQDCTEEDWRIATSSFPPRATRGVWAAAIDVMPMTGLTLWMTNAETPLLRVVPGREATSTDQEPG